jgi:uncharacterized membrane protein
MSPGGGTEVVISVSGKMSDKVATDKKVYRIKGIPGQQEQLEVKQVL